MATRIGVDVGGTFTDLIFYDEETKEISVGKVPTTPDSQDVGVGNAVASVVAPEALNRTELFLHGTTVGINALLERKGAKVGILTTKGFRDVLEVRRALRQDEADHTYDLMWRTPEPLVARPLRLVADERVRQDGTVETDLNEDDVRTAAKTFLAEGVEALAVVFLNAHANPVHERRAKEILREEGFKGELSVSSEVSGEFHEYERTSTCVVDAYIRPKVASYLKKLEGALVDKGFNGDLLITVSGGGALTFDEAAARPFETTMSGPVAGAVGASVLCEAHGIDLAITGDVGGTSFDTALLVNRRPIVKYEGEVVGMPLQTPWVDVRSIGAGGGSIAYADGGLLHVGPKSAGAVPGPVCYRKGGTEPCTTDAAAFLGMLGFGELASGMSLDIDGSRKAITNLGNELGLDAVETAKGIMTIANTAMAEAIRSVSVEQGEDPREAVIIMFGGAGPLFGCLLAQELDASRVLIPNYAGNFSAWGLMSQDIARSTSLTNLAPLDDAELKKANTSLDGLFAELDERAKSSPASVKAVERHVALDMRYVGQEYTLTISPKSKNGNVAENAESLIETFNQEYERTFGHRLDGPIEMVSLRASLRAALPKVANAPMSAKHILSRETRELEAFSFRRDEFMTFSVIDRGTLAPGSKTSGPAIVIEQTATTYVDDGFEIEIHKDGSMYLNDLTK